MKQSDTLHCCPYDKTHRIRKISMGQHLIKCVKNHPFSTKMCCPFDVTHVVESKHFKEHVAVCPNSAYKDQFTFKLTNLTGTIPLRKEDSVSETVSEENWDEVSYAKSYDPFKATEKRRVLRCLIGKSKSEKRRFRKAERLRFQNLDKKDSISQVPKLKMLVQTVTRAHRNTKALLHELLFPEHIGIHNLSIHDTDECLENVFHRFRKLSIRDMDLCHDSIDFHRLSLHDTDAHLENTDSRNLQI